MTMSSEIEPTDSVLFYRNSSSPKHGFETPEGLTYTFWRPSFLNWKPAELPFHPKFLAWALLHHLHIFKNRRFSVFILRSEQRIAHYSFLFPGFFRFGFMGKKHLQIGDTWTEPSFRGQGLASFAIQKITEQHASANTSLWYLTEKDNVPSIRAAEKAGFILAGIGKRTKKLGIALFGSYQISKFQQKSEDSIF